MIERVLVVGGAGYIGGSVTDHLVVRGISFTVYDNLTYENHYLKPVDFVHGDVRDSAKLGALLSRYSHVVWLAALVGDGACALKPDLTYQINQEPLIWLSDHYDGRIVFTSTCSVYGANDEPVTETSATGPLSVYAQTKLAAERYLEGKNALIFRLGTAFGISDTYARIRMDLAINYMTANAITKGKLTIYGGNQWRPFIHVQDIGRIIVESLDGNHRGIFNLATANVTIADVGRLIQEETGCAIEVADRTFEDPRNYHANVAKARAAHLLHADTEYTLQHGIREMKAMVLSRRINNLDHEFYFNHKYLSGAIEQYENGFKEASL